MPKTQPTEKFQALINGVRPFALTRRDMLRLLPSQKIIQRLFHDAIHGPPGQRWIRILREGRPGREALIETASFEKACERFADGESPPLLPSELKRQQVSQQIVGIQKVTQ